MEKKAGIILVNYQDYAERFLAECRDTLRSQDYPARLRQVYIVDNSSSERSRSFLASCFPEARVISRLDGNYAAANNAGIQAARADGCEYFVIANMDTAFRPDWLSELVRVWESKPDAGFVQSKILLYPANNSEKAAPLINSLGNILNFLGFGFTSAYREPDREIAGMPEIGYASGCSLITSAQVLDKIGGYDEEYWMYHDDIEMCWRARIAGYRIYLAPKSVVWHKYEFSRSVRMLYYMERNRYLAMMHYYRLATLVLLLPAIILMELGMLVYAIPGKWLRVKLRVDAYFFNPRVWRGIRAKRRRVKRLRQVPDREVVKCFVGQVLFQEVDNLALKYLANPLFDVYWRIVRKIIQW